MKKEIMNLKSALTAFETVDAVFVAAKIGNKIRSEKTDSDLEIESNRDTAIAAVFEAANTVAGSLFAFSDRQDQSMTCRADSRPSLIISEAREILAAGEKLAANLPAAMTMQEDNLLAEELRDMRK